MGGGKKGHVTAETTEKIKSLYKTVYVSSLKG
jgi:hypothetical protein